jgi:glutamine synthetase
MTAKEQWQAQLASILSELTKRSVPCVTLHFGDLHGKLKAVTVPAHRFQEAATAGIAVDGFQIAGFTPSGGADLLLMPDLRTFRLLPWDGGSARVLCWVSQPNGERFAGDPRHVLDAALRGGEDMGFTCQASVSLQVDLFQSDEGRLTAPTGDGGGYGDPGPDPGTLVRDAASEALDSAGIRIDASRHEAGAGRHGIDLQSGEAMALADGTLTARHALAVIARQHHLQASFLPLPGAGHAGPAMTWGLSLFKTEGQNVFHDPGSRDGLSPTALSFIAGVLHHARALSAVLAPHGESYEASAGGDGTPLSARWHPWDRTALVSAPLIRPDAPKDTRIEVRLPDGGANPYLVLAALLNAGLDGIRRGLIAPEPLAGDAASAKPLPTTLGDALDALASDPVVQAALGEHVYAQFLHLKRAECAAQVPAVST